MKGILVLLGLVALIFTTSAIAAADDPEPWTYAAVKCSGLPHAVLLKGLQDYTTQYGFDHALPVGSIPGAMDVWKAAHTPIVNGYLSLLGCPAAISDDGTQLLPWFKFYAPTYQRILNLP